MTYEFTNEKVGSMKPENFHNNTGETFHIAEIMNATTKIAVNARRRNFFMSSPPFVKNFRYVNKFPCKTQKNPPPYDRG